MPVFTRTASRSLSEPFASDYTLALTRPMPNTRQLRRALLPAFLCLVAACSPFGRPSPPDPRSPEYRDAVIAFGVGLAAIDVGDLERGEARMRQVVDRAPDEPAAWANLGLLALRRKEYDQAAERLERARELAPEVAQISMLLGLVESGRGKPDAALAHFREAVARDPNHLKAHYALAQELQRTGDDASAEKELGEILALRPDNLQALLDAARLAAKRNDVARVAELADRLAAHAAGWPPEAREQFDALRAAQGSAQVGARVAFLRNVLVRTPEFRRANAELEDPPGVIGAPIDRLLWLAMPETAPAPPDTAMRFDAAPIEGAPDGSQAWAGALVLAGDANPVAAFADGRSVRFGGATLAFPGGAAAEPPGPAGVLALDANYDFKTDLVLAGAGGLKLYFQGDGGAFADVTSKATVPADIASAAYRGAWAADVDSDGDLDVVLGPRAAAPIVLRNNGDGTFAVMRPFDGPIDATGLVWTDLDRDGDPDAVFLDATGGLRAFENERLGQFRTRPGPDGLTGLTAIAIGDLAGDGAIDLVTAAGGALAAHSPVPESWQWSSTQLGSLPGTPGAPGSGALFAEDLDNNGSVDLVASNLVKGQEQWAAFLGDGRGAVSPLASATHASVWAVADMTGDGRLDLLGLGDSGGPSLAANHGTKDYQWKQVRPRAKAVTGDQRVNSFGIGGQVELRAGFVVERVPINGPIVHLGMGKNQRADVIRLNWPNGFVQAEFEVGVDAPAVFDQRLEGSCPWLFSFDGTQVVFVTDVLWRSPLGLRINAQDTANTAQTEDWVKVRGDQLAARDGAYDLRITAELWETHFFDHVALLAVDHPEGTEVFVDERFSIPPPALEVVSTEQPRPFATVVDDLGTAVDDVVRARDERYLDTFGRRQYQGVTRDHWVEVELPADAPEGAPLALVASGWIHPTDSSINVAISQGGHEPPRGLSIEVPDGRGGWIVAAEGLGFPAGKEKTIVLRIDGLFRPGAERRLRLRTNLELYWDSLAWARMLPDAPREITRLHATSAELRHRGFSRVAQVDAASPELPDYNRLWRTSPMWRDLEGYHTRFGDVRPLLTGVDDRYVIMNAGDELALRFAALPPPRPGWRRDFVFISDGWEKDGNFNTTFSKTVLPLPAHDIVDYTRPPARLEDDPVYKRHSQDWQDYHTRYVTPYPVDQALKRLRGE